MNPLVKYRVSVMAPDRAFLGSFKARTREEADSIAVQQVEHWKGQACVMVVEERVVNTLGAPLSSRAIDAPATTYPGA